MILGAAWDTLLFVVTTFGVGAACTPSMAARPAVRLIAGMAIALAIEFGLGFAGFAAGLSNARTAAVVAATGGLLLLIRRSTLAQLAAEPETRRLFFTWVVFAAWAVGLLALVVSYSGGGWAADWVEHWQRTQFFLDRQPLDTRFAAIYPLTARPPLANLLIALWLAGTAPTFAHFQLFLTLFGTLILLPIWALAEQWHPSRASNGWVLLALMANPLVAENLTFAWTKLPTAFFVLAALLLSLDALRPTGSARQQLVAVLCFSLAVLTHYSAVPWVIATAAGLLVVNRSAWTTGRFWRRAVTLGLGFALFSSAWVGWAILHFGWHGATAANTTAGAWHEQTAVEHVLVPLRNIADTLVPFPLRGEPGDGLIDQTSRLGRLRDVCFVLYQLNLPFAFGFAGLWVLAKRATPRPNKPASPHRPFYWTLVPAIVVLGIVVHTPRDEWGLVHICLQPLVLFGIAYIAAQLASADRRTRIGWAVLALFDLGLGIGLQFGLESQWLGRFAAPGAQGLALARHLSRAAVANASDKAAFQLQFFADRLHLPITLTVAWLAACALFAIGCLWRATSQSA